MRSRWFVKRCGVRVSVACLVLAIGACSSDNKGTTDGSVADGGVDTVAPNPDVGKDAAEPRPAHCNPLTLDHCFLPWPSSFYLKQDVATKTGFRVNYPADALPKNKKGIHLDPSRYNYLDGFSAASQPLAYFAAGVSAEGLPAIGDPEGGTSDTSLVWIYEMSTGKRVALFAEIDANAADPHMPALIIRTLAPMKHDERHVVVLRKGIKNAAGDPLTTPEPFRQLRDDEVDPANAALAAEAERMKPVIDFLKAQQIEMSDVLLAWDFHTVSAEAVTGPLLKMVDEALAKVPADGPAYTLTKVTEHPAETNKDIWFEIEGEMEVPSFLESEDPDAWLNLDQNGLPEFRAMQKFPFRVTIPRCAETASGSLPIVLYGHGIFGKDEALTWSYPRKMINRLCVVAAATNWLGMSEADEGAVGIQVLPDFSMAPRITDPLQQGHVNFQVLAELMQGKFLADDALKIGGTPVTDGQEIYYIGISLGGTAGATFAALNKRIKRYVLNVPGAWWSQMIQRSSGFFEFAMLTAYMHESPTDVVTIIHMIQSLFDYTDPINFARHLITEPLAGRQAKAILFQEAMWDELVPNITTRAMVRAAGVPLLKPAYESVYGVEEKDGPLPSAYVQWETDPGAIPPTTNVAAEDLERDESPHEQLRRTESFSLQIEAFLKPDGMVEQTCGGVCTTKSN